MSNNNPKTPPPLPRFGGANQTQSNQKPSRFGGSSSRFGGNNNNSSGSRFGGSSRSRFGSSSSRFSAATTADTLWTVSPLQKSAVRISMQGLGDPIHRLLKTPLNPDLSDTQKLLDMLAKDSELSEQLIALLDEAWESYDFRGAALTYNWEDEVNKAFSQMPHPLPTPPPKPEENDSEDYEYYDDEDESNDSAPVVQARSGIQCLRAVDAIFVMNVLARSRANVIASNTPIALEIGFLSKTIICDDPRLVNLARATGCIEEAW